MSDFFLKKKPLWHWSRFWSTLTIDLSRWTLMRFTGSFWLKVKNWIFFFILRYKFQKNGKNVFFIWNIIWFYGRLVSINVSVVGFILDTYRMIQIKKRVHHFSSIQKDHCEAKHTVDGVVNFLSFTFWLYVTCRLLSLANWPTPWV